MKKMNQAWILVLILVLSLALRLTGIEWGLPSKTETLHTFHPDESIILTGLSAMNPSKFDFNPHNFMGGTSHYYVSAAVLKACSSLRLIKLSSDKEFYRNNFREMDKVFLAGRAMSVTFALLTILLVFFIGKEVYNEKVGLWAAFFMSMLPIHVIDSHYMTFDTPVTYWFILALFFSVKIYGDSRRRWYVLAGISAAMACGAKYYGGAAVLFPVFAHMAKERKDGESPVLYKKILLVLISFTAAFVVTNPYMVLDYREAIRHISITFSLTKMRAGVEIMKGSGLLLYPALLTFDLGIPLALFSFAGFLMQFKQMDRKISLLVFALFSFYIPMSLSYTKMEHYMLPITPILALFSASLLFYFKHRVLKIAAALVIAYTLFYSCGYVGIMAGKGTRIQATEWIRANIPADTKIGAINFYFYTPPALYSYMHLMPENAKAVYYRAVLTGYDIEKLKKERPQYFVITDFEYSEDYQAFWKIGDVQSKKRFLEFLMNGVMYKEIRAFTEYPSLFGLKLDTRRPPWHIRFLKPEIKIYELKENI